MMHPFRASIRQSRVDKGSSNHQHQEQAPTQPSLSIKAKNYKPFRFSRRFSFSNQQEELGTIRYTNFNPRTKQGSIESALQLAHQSRKPIFANFVELPGCDAGVAREAGNTIFSDPLVKKMIQTHFVPAAFNTWDRFNPGHNHAIKRWGGDLAASDGGYVRIIGCDGNTILGATGHIRGKQSKQDVLLAIAQALVELDYPLPVELRAEIKAHQQVIEI
jgi:hypothetical protein